MSPRILIVGAGSMGIVVGYHLQLASADVTFLIRPHRTEALNRPQLLYCHEDHELKKFDGFKCITFPSDITLDYDFIYVTLDSASLRSAEGQELVRTIGKKAGDAKIIVGSVFINLIPWFLQVSGLPLEQVTHGFLLIHAYPAQAITQPGVKQDLIGQADVAYTDRLGHGIILDDSSPIVAREFADIWNSSGSHSAIQPKMQLALMANPIFAIYAACDLHGWPKMQDMRGETWELGAAAAKEIQSLSLHGEMGQQAAQQPSSQLHEAMISLEKSMLPFDLAAFNQFHHGRKVSQQDAEHLRACLGMGEAEGLSMSNLKELMRRIETPNKAEA